MMQNEDISVIRGVANCENFIANELLNPHKETGVPVLPSKMPSEDELLISSIEKLRKKRILSCNILLKNDPLNEYSIFSINGNSNIISIWNRRYNRSGSGSK
jgi:hypothetical protein